MRLLQAAAVALLIAPSLEVSAHQGHSSNAAWAACEGVELGETCSFEDPAHAVYRGTCRRISGALVCVRNQPIEHPSADTPAEPRPLVWAGMGFLAIVGGVMLRRRTTTRATDDSNSVG